MRLIEEAKHLPRLFLLRAPLRDRRSAIASTYASRDGYYATSPITALELYLDVLSLLAQFGVLSRNFALINVRSPRIF